MATKKSKKIIAGILLLIIASAAFYWLYNSVYGKSNSLNGKKYIYLHIPSDADFDDVLELIKEEQVVKNVSQFRLLAEFKKYNEKVKPGRFRINQNMSNLEIVNLLISGKQELVSFNFYNIRTPEQMASKAGSILEADESELLSLMNDNDYLNNTFGINANTVMTLFVPKQYKLKWNTNAKDFLQIMSQEYNKIWTRERVKKAQSIKLTRSEVAILASIVQEEQSVYKDERPLIAGLYLNRLAKRMPLQSDPTVIFAHGNFEMNRVLKKDLSIDSPFNTYVYTGLPPGPIAIPEVHAIDAVLNFKKSDYLYMCAKEDFSGRHNFTNNYSVHLRNADKYQNALDRKNIKR